MFELEESIAHFVNREDALAELEHILDHCEGEYDLDSIGDEVIAWNDRCQRFYIMQSDCTDDNDTFWNIVIKNTLK